MQVKVGLVQMTPSFFDNETTLELMAIHLEQLSAEGCQLVLFPESVLPGYPRGFDFDAVVGRRTEAGRKLWQEYWEAAVEPDGKEAEFLQDLATIYRVYIAVGVTERDSQTGSLYCSLWYFSPQGGLIARHRKLKPTGTERLVWAEGQGEDLITLATPIGRLSGLICWENYMPLARYALFQQGVDIHLAPTADARPVWGASMQHIALEGRCFVLSCNQFFLKSDYPERYQWLLRSDEPENMCRGGSLIVDPLGQIVAGPLWDEEGTLTATIDLSAVSRSRLDFAVNGHYQRPDIFTLDVRGQSPQKKITD